MAQDYDTWIVILPLDKLAMASPDQVVYRLPEAVSDGMCRADAFATASRADALHHQLRKILKVFEATSLGFLDRDPWARDDLEAIRAASDGFVISALLPQDIPAALDAIDEILKDTGRLGIAMEIHAFSDEDLAAHCAPAGDAEYDPCAVDGIEFLVRLRAILERALAQGDAVVQARDICL